MPAARNGCQRVNGWQSRARGLLGLAPFDREKCSSRRSGKGLRPNSALEKPASESHAKTGSHWKGIGVAAEMSSRQVQWDKIGQRAAGVVQLCGQFPLVRRSASGGQLRPRGRSSLKKTPGRFALSTLLFLLVLWLGQAADDPTALRGRLQGFVRGIRPTDCDGVGLRLDGVGDLEVLVLGEGEKCL